MSPDPARRLDLRSRKAGGVFYTPRPLADHMAERALAPLLERASPDRVDRLRILDPACGAGVFLVSAFERLCAWRREQGEAPTGAEQRRLLETTLFGLDLDPVAIAAAQRELLQAWGGEPGGEAPLPNLRWGNALVDGGHDQLKSGSGEHAARLRPFDWSDPAAGFGGVLAEGGFDLVLGNPPYRRERGWSAQLEEIAGSDFGRRWRRPRMDLWFYFLHRSLELLKPRGRLCFVVNAYWTRSSGAEALIGQLQRECRIEELLLLGGQTVFEGVAGRHLVLLLSKGSPGGATRIRRVPPGVPLPAALASPSGMAEWSKSAEELFVPGGLDLEPPAAELLARIEQGTPLGRLGAVRQGIAENPASINHRTSERFGGRYRVGAGVFVLGDDELDALGLSEAELGLARPYHLNADLGRYWRRPEASHRLLYLTEESCPDVSVYPGLERHLAPFRPILDERRETRLGARAWWQLHWPRDPALWTSDKILALQMAPRPAFAFARGECLVPFSVNVFVPDPAVPESPHYLLGVLNSRLLWKWFRHRAKRRGVGLDLGGEVLRRAPIARIDFADERSRSLHDQVAAAAERLSELAPAPRQDSDPEVAPEMVKLEGALDAAVYALYGLTDEERALVDAQAGEDE